MNKLVRQPREGRVLSPGEVTTESIRSSVAKLITTFEKDIREALNICTQLRSITTITEGTYSDFRKKCKRLTELDGMCRGGHDEINAQLAQLANDSSKATRALWLKKPKLDQQMIDLLRESARSHTTVVFLWVRQAEKRQPVPWGIEDEIKQHFEHADAAETEHAKMNDEEQASATRALVEDVRALLPRLVDIFKTIPRFGEPPKS